MKKDKENNFFKSVKFIKQCREEGLSLWECPNFLFVFTGLISMVSISGTYYLASYYFPPEVVIVWIGFVSFVMLVISFLVNQGMTKITHAKKVLKENNEKLENALLEARKAKKMQEEAAALIKDTQNRCQHPSDQQYVESVDYGDYWNEYGK